ncbi:MAG: recombinase family protein [Vulcanimicrobiaceae bacterium]
MVPFCRELRGRFGTITRIAWVALYARVSHDDQKQALERQLGRLMRLCSSHATHVRRTAEFRRDGSTRLRPAYRCAVKP